MNPVDPLAPPEKPLAVEITSTGGLVIMHLSQPRENIPMKGLEPAHVGAKLLANAVVADQQTAQPVLDLCMAVMDSVYEACGHLKPAGGAAKHELVERHRRTLTRRLGVVLNSMREKKAVSNGKLAKEVVDICLHEIFS
jgi:hypothetical protein